MQGLGRRYGIESLMIGRKRLPYNDLRAKIVNYPSLIDSSWKDEWKTLLRAIQDKSSLIGSARDGLKANLIVEAAYTSSQEKRTIRL